MQAKLAEADQMTIAEFLAFMDSRPDGERWELIEGVAYGCRVRTQIEQCVTVNIAMALTNAKHAAEAQWTPILGVFTQVPVAPNTLLRPDLFVKEAEPEDAVTTADALVIFEVLAKTDDNSARTWRKRVYASVPNCQHYVAVSTKSAEIIRHDRADGWVGTIVHGLDATLALPAIKANVALRDTYRGTPIA